MAVSIESFSRGNSAAKGRPTEKGGLFAFHGKSVLLRGWSQLRAVAPHFLLRPEKICKSLDIHLQHAQQGASGHRVHLEKGTSGFPFATMAFDPIDLFQKSINVHLEKGTSGFPFATVAFDPINLFQKSNIVRLEKGTSGFPFATFDPLGGKPNCGLWDRGENYYGVKNFCHFQIQIPEKYGTAMC